MARLVTLTADFVQRIKQRQEPFEVRQPLDINADFRRLPTCLFHTQLRPQRIQVFPMFLLS